MRSRLKSIFYIQFTDPCGYPPLEHSSKILADKGWAVLFLGTEAYGATNFSFTYNKNVEVRKQKFYSIVWLRKAHYFFYTAQVFLKALLAKPQWIYASDFLACLPALLLSYCGFKVIYHEHDWPSFKVKSSFFSFGTVFLELVRKEVGKKAYLVIMPNQKRLDRFLDYVDRKGKSACVWNCPLTSEVRTRHDLNKKDEIWGLYHGSIVPARLPLTILDAMVNCSGIIKLRIVGYETMGHIGYLEEFLAHARDLGLGRRMDIHPAVPRNKLFELSQDCDFGIAFMPEVTDDLNMQAMVGASNKPFDYLACGLALLVSDLPEWNEMFVRPSYGISCVSDDALSITTAFKWFLANHKAMRRIGNSGQKKILSDWNYEQQFEPVLRIIEQ